MRANISRSSNRFSVVPFSAAIIAAATTLIAASFFPACSRDESTSTEPVAQVNAGFPSAKTLNSRLGKGVNLGNALDAPTEGAWGVTLKAEWFGRIADSGFSTVRIPVRWSAHALDAPPYTIDSAFMQRVAWAVDKALAAKLNVVIDMHHYDAIMAGPEAEKARFLAMWRQIAKRFADYPPGLLLELLNEPRDAMDADTWNRFLKSAIDTIRAVQPRRTLIVGTTPWGSLAGLSRLQLPADTNLIVTVHYYEPHVFTHQGAKFETGADAWLGTLWRATATQRALIDLDINLIRDWAADNDRPIFLGEFGTYEAADSLSRALYTEYLTTGFNRAGFSWTLWNYGSDFGLMVDSNETWRNFLTQALLHPGGNAYLNTIIEASKPPDLGKYLVFDDFEDSLSDLPSSAAAWMGKAGLPPDSSSARWYAYYSDSSRIADPDGNRILQYFETGPDTTPSNFGAAIGDWGSQGRGLHAKVRLQGSNYPYAGFGAGLFQGWSSSFTDLTPLTAVQFRAKGRGQWNLMIISDSVSNGYDKDSTWGQMSARFALKDQWETFVIPAETLTPVPHSQQDHEHLTWEDVRGKIIAVQFQSGQSYGLHPDDSLEIWLDDIRLIGVDKAGFGL